MNRGGKRSTTWQKGQIPIKKKGCKSRRTRLKESLGLQNWDGLRTFIEKDGASKLITEMKKLRGKAYIQAYSSLCEFIKPKLSRISADIAGGIQIKDRIKLTNEKIRQIHKALEGEV